MLDEPEIAPLGKEPRLAMGMKSKKGKLRDITYSSLDLIFREDNVQHHRRSV
jgi:hypothetical protein